MITRNRIRKLALLAAALLLLYFGLVFAGYLALPAEAVMVVGPGA